MGNTLPQMGNTGAMLELYAILAGLKIEKKCTNHYK